jgi:cephalosporin hydroxylase
MGAQLHERPVIASLGFHLGDDLQRNAMRVGYDQAAEDEMLERARWHEDGYRLFELSVFAGSSAGGYFAPMAESSALFMPRGMWAELGGYEERFEQPGGGLANLDVYRRACLLPDVGHVVLLGEGTFHQVHGGTVTNTDPSPWPDLQREYVRIRGEPFTPPRVEPVFVGRVHQAALPALTRSAEMAGACRWEDTESHPGRPRAESMAEPRCGLSGAQLSAIQSGVLQTRYRERRMLKSPFDLVLYTQLVQRLRPLSVIELGSGDGGSALWFADVLANHGIDAHVYSIDLDPPEGVDHAAVTFMAGDVRDLGKTLDGDWWDALPHPLLVIEDSAHDFESTLAALEFFHPRLLPGDYICVEDGVVRFLPDERYRRFEDGPTRAIAALLERHPEKYEIDRSLCDYFGRNVTYNPNGYLRRVT